MELKGNKHNWQSGNYFESWLMYVSTCPNCDQELFNSKNNYRDVSRIVQCSCGARMSWKPSLKNTSIKALIEKHNFELITKEKEMDIVDKAKAVVGMKPKKEKTRLQIIKSENADLTKKLEANRVELRDVANTTVDGRTGDNSALERKEKELADKLVSNKREIIDIELAKIEAKFGKKEKALDAKKSKLEDKKEEAKKALDDFNKADGAYSKLKEEKSKAQSPWYEMKGRMAD